MIKRIFFTGIIFLSSQVFANNLDHDKTYRLFSFKDLPKSLQRASAKSLKNFHPIKMTANAKASTESEFDQNKYRKTERPLDIALLDEGYILTRTPDLFRTYVETRFGRMDVNKDGELVIYDLNVQGDTCQYPDSNWPGTLDYNCDIHITSPILPPEATSLVNMKLNINTAISKSQNYNADFSVFDSRGERHEFSVQFFDI